MRASIYFPGSVSDELGLIRTTRPSSTCTMAVFVARAISSARLRARRRAGSASANSGVRACSTGFGFIASRPSLAEQARAASCRRVPKRPRWACTGPRSSPVLLQIVGESRLPERRARPGRLAPEPVGSSTFSRRRSGGAPVEVRVVLRQRQLDRGGIRRNHHLRLLTLSESEEVARVERQQHVGACAFGFDKVKRVVHGTRLQRT